MGLLLLLLPMLVAAAPQSARASAVDELRKARESFEYGDYERARQIAEALLKKNVLASDDQLIDANRIVALAYFYGPAPDRRERAERYFLQLLSIEPEYRLDPFFTPPAAVEFFDSVRREHEEQLAPIREQRRLAKEARRAEEEARRRFQEEQARAARDSQTGSGEVVERRHLALVFLPLGAGQFQNGDRSAGYFLASVQTVAGLTSAATFLAVHNLTPGGKVQHRDVGLVRTLDTMKWASAAIFYLAWGYGVLDAWSNFEAEVGREAPEADLEVRAPKTPTALPFAAAASDGATIGFSLQF